ncbi:hypothetical protein U1Q18_018029, partial [Sarracenia purpurea var. burkii]
LPLGCKADATNFAAIDLLKQLLSLRDVVSKTRKALGARDPIVFRRWAETYVEPYGLLPKQLSQLHSYSCLDALSLRYPLRPSPVLEACLVRATKQSKLTGSNVVEVSNR